MIALLMSLLTSWPAEAREATAPLHTRHLLHVPAERGLRELRAHLTLVMSRGGTEVQGSLCWRRGDAQHAAGSLTLALTCGQATEERAREFLEAEYVPLLTGFWLERELNANEARLIAPDIVEVTLPASSAFRQYLGSGVTAPSWLRLDQRGLPLEIATPLVELSPDMVPCEHLTTFEYEATPQGSLLKEMRGMCLLIARHGADTVPTRHCMEHVYRSYLYEDCSGLRLPTRLQSRHRQTDLGWRGPELSIAGYEVTRDR